MKITFPELTALLAEATGSSKKKSEDFLKALFSTISTTLTEDGESVKVPALGTFKLVVIEARKSVNVTTGMEFEIPSHKRVSFIPSKEIAARINLPFSAFESVELSDNVTDEDLEAADKVMVPPPLKPTVATPPTHLVPPIPTVVPKVETEPESEEQEDEIAEAEKQDFDNQPQTGNAADVEPEVIDSEADDNDDETVTPPTVQPQDENRPEIVEKPRKGHFWIGLCAGIFGMLAIIAATFWIDRTYNNSNLVGYILPTSANPVVVEPTKTVETPADNPATDSASADQTQEDAAIHEEAPETKPSDMEKEPVYDTVSTTRYLTTIARDHYGNYNLWPYIYMENKSKLGNPDRIKPGTKVLVPDLKKYGVDPSNPADIEKAKKKAAEIYAQFK